MTDALPKAAAAEHLTQALRQSGALGEGRVAAVTVEKSFPTLLSHFYRLCLAYEGAAGDAPVSLMLKTNALGRPSSAWGRQEVSFYHQVGAGTPAGLVPRCFDAHFEPADNAWHLLLEDLSESHLIATQWPLPPTFEQCERIVRTRARFHAAWWDHPRLGVTVSAWQDTATADKGMQSLAEQYARFADMLGDRLSAERRQLYARLFDQAPRLMERYHAHRHITVVQGDAHVWNCFLPRSGGLDDARLFDWDAWRLDVGADDLAYMMAIHWYPELRHRNERRLLDCYHDELLSHGVQGYDRRALEDDYRQSVLWQILTPVWMCTSNIPPLIWWNNLERVHLAVEDLGCRDLLAG